MSEHSILVMDSYAVIAFLQKERGSDHVGHWLNLAQNQKCALKMSLINWGEVYYSMYRSKGAEKAQQAVFIMEELNIQQIDVDRDLIYQAAKLKSLYTISYADCFAAALAQREQCPILTGDKDFKKFSSSEISIVWI